MQAAATAGFTTNVPLYIVNVPLHQVNPAWLNITMAFGSLAQKLIHKELYLSDKEMSGCSHEQLKLVDFMVIAKSKAFVGSASSTYSMYAREYRHIMKLGDRSSSKLVTGGNVGAGDLLSQCGALM